MILLVTALTKETYFNFFSFIYSVGHIGAEFKIIEPKVAFGNLIPIETETNPIRPNPKQSPFTKRSLERKRIPRFDQISIFRVQNPPRFGDARRKVHKKAKYEILRGEFKNSQRFTKSREAHSVASKSRVNAKTFKP